MLRDAGSKNGIDLDRPSCPERDVELGARIQGAALKAVIERRKSFDSVMRWWRS